MSDQEQFTNTTQALEAFFSLQLERERLILKAFQVFQSSATKMTCHAPLPNAQDCKIALEALRLTQTAIGNTKVVFTLRPVHVSIVAGKMSALLSLEQLSTYVIEVTQQISAYYERIDRTSNPTKHTLLRTLELHIDELAHAMNTIPAELDEWRQIMRERHMQNLRTSPGKPHLYIIRSDEAERGRDDE